MSYNAFVSDALKNYKALPYEANELYKRQGVGFSLDEYEEALRSGGVIDGALGEYAESAAAKLRTKFDAVIGDGAIIYNSVPGLKLVPMETAYNEFSKDSMHRSTEDKFVAFANAYAKNALVLDVAPGANIVINVLLVYGATAPPLQLFVNGGEGSRFALNEVFASKDGDIMSGILQEIRVGKNSVVEVNSLHSENVGTRSFGLMKASAGDGASLRVNNLYSGSGTSRHRSGLLSEGRGANIDSNDVILGSDEQKFDLYTATINEGAGTRCSVETKAVALDRSVMIVKGMAKIIHGSKKSTSYLKERGVLYDRGTQIRMMPDMSIDESDVKATHSSSVSPIDDDSLFYLASRGLQQENAKRVMIDGFMLGTLGRIVNTHARMLATALAIGKLRDRVIGLREIDAKDAWASASGQQQGMFADSYKYQYGGGAR